MSDIEDDESSIYEEEYESSDEIIYEQEDNNTVIYEHRIPDNERMTCDKMSYLEYIKIIALRATVLSNNTLDKPITYTDVDDILKSSSHNKEVEMAIREIRDKKCPYLLKRYVGKNMYEIWDVNELIVPLN